MPSTQTPPITTPAIDPTALRPAIDDARIERVTPAQLHERLRALRDEGFALLLDVGAADYLQRDPRFDVVYHLLRLSAASRTIDEIGTPARVRVLCGVGADAPRIPGVTDLWKRPDWADRPVYDLFCFMLDGQPALRRTPMPNGRAGHPLRKDYPLRGPAREKSPRPAFALKSNVRAGTPPSGRTLEALQRQIEQVRDKR